VGSEIAQSGQCPGYWLDDLVLDSQMGQRILSSPHPTSCGAQPISYPLFTEGTFHSG
jgi:hypothetical protein